MSLTVLAPSSFSPGWAPVHALGSLISRVLGGVPLGLDQEAGKLRYVWNLRPCRRGSGEDVLLALLYRPDDIRRLRTTPAFRDVRYRAVVVWIIDSFHALPWTSTYDFRDVDLVCITRATEYPFYRKLLGDRVLALNWGADVLDRPFRSGLRPTDLQRMGRQPRSWDDDRLSHGRLAAAGLSFAGRPPMHDDPHDNQQEVCRAYGKAKYVLAHSNLVDTSHYTHRIKEYVTARWTDALASGCSVAGVPPRNDSTFQDLFWPGATLDFDRIDLDDNIAALREAVAAWTPERARYNYLMALRRLDWRHSLKKIADTVSLRAPVLNAELARIDQILASDPDRLRVAAA